MDLLLTVSLDELSWMQSRRHLMILWFWRRCCPSVCHSWRLIYPYFTLYFKSSVTLFLNSIIVNQNAYFTELKSFSMFICVLSRDEFLVQVTNLHAYGNHDVSDHFGCLHELISHQAMTRRPGGFWDSSRGRHGGLRPSWLGMTRVPVLSLLWWFKRV